MIDAPSLDWSTGQPVNRAFADPYFSAIDGWAESQHVFLRGNALPERFAECRQHTIGELGFGTGLNLLASWAAFAEHAPGDAVLDYVSVEAQPLAPADWRRALAAFEQQLPAATRALADELLPACNDLHPGFNLRTLRGGRIRLLLLVGDVDAVLPQLEARIDSWFLDGFAPARNPAMWSPTVCAQLARLSADRATLASYTAAGWVRRNLQDAGFDIEKRPGFSRKRDMITGRLRAPAWRSALPDWARAPAADISSGVAVVGGGLAGSATALALAQRGVKVTLYDDASAAAPSRLPRLLLRSFPERANDLRGQFYQAATAHACARLDGTPGWQPTPVAVMNRINGKQTSTHNQAALAQASDLPVPRDGFVLQRAGTLDPAAVCAAWQSHPNIDLRKSRAPDQPNAPTVLATGASGADKLQVLPHSLARGQMTRLAARTGSTVPIAGQGWMIPGERDCWIGASHKRNDTGIDARPAEANDYLRHWDWLLPDDPDFLEHATAVRVSLTDRLPSVGPLTTQTFANWGHGARGATAALLCGELIAAQLTNTPLPLSADTIAALHPGRFAERIRR